MKKLLVLAVCVTALFPVFVSAAGIATVTGNRVETGHIFWRNGSIVFSQPGRQRLNRVILKGNDVFFVYAPGVTPRVVEMSGMANMAGILTGRSGKSPRELLGRITSVQATGETETVAGIKGHVYRVTVQSDGNQKTYRAVLTDNPTVVSLTQLVITRAKAVLGDKSHVLERYLSAFPAEYRGVLKLGQRFQFTSVTSRVPPDKWFQLPAKPKSFVQTMIRNMANRILGGMGR